MDKLLQMGHQSQVMKVKRFCNWGLIFQVKRCIPVPEERTLPFKGHIKVIGARQNNLGDIDVEFLLGCLTAVTGVSGSGKSSLVSSILAPSALQRKRSGSDVSPGAHDEIEGIDNVDKVIVIDQSPIGRTPRSNPATYTKAFDEIRKLFSETTLAKERRIHPWTLFIQRKRRKM